jgi:hypothetical protein
MGSPSVARRHTPMRGGSFAVESVAGFTWNRWQLWRGIRTLTAGEARECSLPLRLGPLCGIVVRGWSGCVGAKGVDLGMT